MYKFRMSRRSILEMKLASIEESIYEMESNNDGSIRWVDDLRSLHIELDTINSELADLNQEEFCMVRGY